MKLRIRNILLHIIINMDMYMCMSVEGVLLNIALFASFEMKFDAKKKKV